MDSSEWGQRTAEPDQANGARIYDCLLGGSHNFAVDREAVRQLFKINPESDKVARSNREFLGRAVRYCVAQGVDQFLDLGSGVPTVGNVHEIAQKANPLARVVYVDFEPIAVNVTQELLAGNDLADVVHADFREPEVVLAGEAAKRLLDLTRPVAVLMVAALHYVPDSDALPGILAKYVAPLAPGSHLVLSHITDDDNPAIARAGKEVFDAGQTPMYLRGREELTELLACVDLVPPGLVHAPVWRPNGTEVYSTEPARSFTYAAVGTVR